MALSLPHHPWTFPLNPGRREAPRWRKKRGITTNLAFIARMGALGHNPAGTVLLLLRLRLDQGFPTSYGRTYQFLPL